MPHLFSPSWLKKADRFSKGVRKFIAYQRDLIPDAKMAEVMEAKAAYDTALKAKDKETLEGLEKRLLKVCEGAVPNYNASPLKENVEVIIVAVIVALGIRAYFLQPFKIPTASMQPTLNGIIATRLDANQARQALALSEAQLEASRRSIDETDARLDGATIRMNRLRELVADDVEGVAFTTAGGLSDVAEPAGGIAMLIVDGPIEQDFSVTLTRRGGVTENYDVAKLSAMGTDDEYRAAGIVRRPGRSARTARAPGPARPLHAPRSARPVRRPHAAAHRGRRRVRAVAGGPH